MYVHDPRRVMTTAEQTGTETEQTHGVVLTEAAAAKAKALLEQEGRDDMHLRLAVQPGGCAGLRYQLFFTRVRWTVTCSASSPAGGGRRTGGPRRTCRPRSSTSWTPSRSRASRSTTRAPRARVRAATASTAQPLENAFGIFVADARRRFGGGLRACRCAVELARAG